MEITVFERAERAKRPEISVFACAQRPEIVVFERAKRRHQSPWYWRAGCPGQWVSTVLGGEGGGPPPQDLHLY